MYIIHFTHKVNGEHLYLEPVYMEGLEPNDFFPMRAWFYQQLSILFGYSQEKAARILLDMMDPNNIKLDQWLTITNTDDVSTLFYKILLVPETATFPRGA